MSVRTVRVANFRHCQILLQEHSYAGIEGGVINEDSPICPACFSAFRPENVEDGGFFPCPHCGTEIYVEVREVTSVVWWTHIEGPSVATV